jgi:hypothetical protein
MRLTCPACQAAVSVPDTEAGKEVECTSCKAKFIAPELMATYAVADTAELFPEPPKAEPPPTIKSDNGAPPIPEKVAASTASIDAPSLEKIELPPVPLPASPEIPKPTTSKPPGEYENHFSFGIQHRIIVWVPAVCLTLAFFFSFFKWVGLFPGGYTAYSQNAWQALFANFSSDPVCEQVLKLEQTINKQIRTSWWLFPYLLALFPAVVLTWFGHVVTRYNLLDRLPPLIRQVWHLRTQVLVGLTAFTLAMLLLQTWADFGLANGLKRGVEAEFAPKLEAAAVNSVEEEKVRVEMAVALHNYHVNTTTWMRLTVWAHLIAVLAIAIENWLVTRGKKPIPRVGVMW